MPARSIASEYQLESVSRTASSSTASRPMRWITSGAGTLPRRKPGSFSSRPSWRALRSSAPRPPRRHLHLQAHARVAELGDRGLQRLLAPRHDTVPPMSAHVRSQRPAPARRRRGCGPGPSATSSAARWTSLAALARYRSRGRAAGPIAARSGARARASARARDAPAVRRLRRPSRARTAGATPRGQHEHRAASRSRSGARPRS